MPGEGDRSTSGVQVTRREELNVVILAGRRIYDPGCEPTRHIVNNPGLKHRLDIKSSGIETVSRTCSSPKH